jgi:hypothetical protein
MSQHDQPTPDAGSEALAPPSCPKCAGPMWDNREGKRNPKAPDFKCKDRNCQGVIWPPRAAGDAAGGQAPDAGGAAPPTPNCPICGGPMWDDRATKRNPKAPDFKCKNKPRFRGGPGCEGVIWPPREGSSGASRAAAPAARPAPKPTPRPAPKPSARSMDGPLPADGPPPWDGPAPWDDAPPHDDDDLPF